MSKKKDKTEKKAESKGSSKKNSPKTQKKITAWGIGCAVLAIICGFANKIHVESLFENDKHFSHLSTMERDMAFRAD